MRWYHEKCKAWHRGYPPLNCPNVGRKIKVGDKVLLKGTKSRGDKWEEFITNPHFLPRKKEDVYGVVHFIGGKEVWIYIYDNKTNELLDKSTWGFMEEDLIWQ